MADAKISALASLAGANVSSSIDVFPIVATASSTTKKITFQAAADAMNTLVSVTSGQVSSADVVSLFSVSTTATKIMTLAGLANVVGIPIVSKSAAYTTLWGDGNGGILHPTADNSARTFTIDSNANVPYPVGTAITFVNQINTVTIAITADTMTLAGGSSTGNRTLASGGIATALKISTTGWIIAGTGLT